MQRRKGAAAERELAKELVRLFALHGIEATAMRTAPLQSGAARGLIPKEVSAADVTCSLLPDDHVESKRCEDIRMAEWCAQAERDANGRRWLVAWRQNRQPWRVTVPLAYVLPMGLPAATAGLTTAAARGVLVTLLLADFVAVRAAQGASK